MTDRDYDLWRPRRRPGAYRPAVPEPYWCRACGGRGYLVPEVEPIRAVIKCPDCRGRGRTEREGSA